jgi:cytochrome c-type biogenesis protein CcmF
LGIALTTGLILKRLDYLKSEAHLESVLSRESSFLFNNLILLASCFAVLWGTMFPVITEAVLGEKVTVGAPFFNKVNIPIGLFLLFLTGVGPLIAWRRSSWESLKRAFFWPTLCFAATVAVLLAFGVRHFYALVSLGLCAFVTCTIVMEFWKGARAIALRNKMNLLMATVELTHRNTRRYGGYLVHMGIVLMFIGFTGAAFNKDTTREVKLGDRFSLGAYEFHVKDVSDGDNPNYMWQHAIIGVYKHGTHLGDLMPERRVYLASEQPTSEVAIRRRLNEDVYLNFAGMSQTDPGRAIIQAYLFPLVSWIWIGFWVLLFGTLVCLVPSKVRYAYPKTEVVGAYAKETVAR